MKTVAIIVAGGSGKRIEGNLPKQFLMLSGKPILAHTIEKFERCDLVDEIILVVPESYLDYCSQSIVDKYGFGKIRRITCGGEERQDSVYQGLKAFSDSTSIVAIHDGVRPLVTPEIVAGSIKLCQQKKAVIVAVPAKDTIKRVECGLVTATLDRRELWLVQTPQVFEYKLIMEAHKKAREENFIGTDDSVLVERLGCEVSVLEGNYNNIKITTTEDLLVAEKLLKTEAGE
ncbi:MAG: 2-C-methyl-D-erythritol 4-phosphate cytidylyltransferase [Candidatus Saganbacteria bacterium]|nr:2-C-methyl-D-erythritol 4-phosphate cytidylyltransferase [Candidatus Saganbacteria bacterium]